MSLFNGDRISLRALEPEDIDYLYAWENNTEIWWLGNTLKPYSKDTLKKYLASAHLDINETQQVRFAIHKNEKNTDLIGLIDLYDFEPHHLRAGVGILLGKLDDRNKGYGSEALKLLCEYAFSILGLYQLYCTIPENNMASLRLFEKAGFIQTGTRTKWLKSREGWIDEIFFQLSVDEWDKRTE